MRSPVHGLSKSHVELGLFLEDGTPRLFLGRFVSCRAEKKIPRLFLDPSRLPESGSNCTCDIGAPVRSGQERGLHITCGIRFCFRTPGPRLVSRTVCFLSTPKKI